MSRGPLRAVLLEHVKHLLDLFHTRSLEVPRIARAVVGVEDAECVALERVHQTVHEEATVLPDLVLYFVDDVLAAKHLDLKTKITKKQHVRMMCATRPGPAAPHQTRNSLLSPSLSKNSAAQVVAAGFSQLSDS